MITIRKPYGKRNRVQYISSGDSRTKQSFTDECNINKIMARYQKTGAIDHVRNHGGSYGFASAADFLQSMLIVNQATEMFAELPSSIRTKFNNNPAEFLEFTQDPANEAEMAELGLIDSDPSPDANVPEGDVNPAQTAENTPPPVSGEA